MEEYIPKSKTYSCSEKLSSSSSSSSSEGSLDAAEGVVTRVEHSKQQKFDRYQIIYLIWMLPVRSNICIYGLHIYYSKYHQDTNFIFANDNN